MLSDEGELRRLMSERLCVGAAADGARRQRCGARPSSRAWARGLIIGVAMRFLGRVPDRSAGGGLRRGVAQGRRAFISRRSRSPEARSAIRLTLLTAAIAVPLNLVFGLAASWAITRFEFRGKNLLTTLIDLPFAVSPVIAGMIYRAAVRRAGMVRRLAGRARHQDHLRGSGNRAGDDLRDVSVRRARTDSR